MHFNSFIQKNWHTWQIIFMEMYNYILNSFSMHFRLTLASLPAWKPLQIYLQLHVSYTNFFVYIVQKWNETDRYIIPKNAIIFMVIILPSKRDSCQRMFGFFFFLPGIWLSNFRIQKTIFLLQIPREFFENRDKKK